MAFSGADWCVGTAMMPLRDAHGRHRPVAIVSEALADFQCEHPARASSRDPLICGYLKKTTAFSGAD